MKTTIKYLLLFTAAIVFTACNSAQTSSDTDSTNRAHQKNRVDTVANNTVTISSITLKDEHLNAIIQQYLDLTKALTDEDATGAKVAASAIELGATKIKGAQQIAKAASGITNANDIESQRNLFSGLSDSFIALLKQSGIAAGQLYILHCPMAMNNNGANWISTSKTVRNPYYGESMLTCGSVKETLN